MARHNGTTTVEREIADLRRQAEALMADQVAPAATSLTEDTKAFATETAETVRHQTENARDAVRGHPLLAIAAASAVGMVCGLMLRR